MPERRSAAAEELGFHLLVLRCQTGDEHAFARLYERFGERTLRYLRGLVGDAADDVQQEVWLSVYRNIGTLADPRAFRTWLYRTTRHRAVDHLRQQTRERELLADAAQEALTAVSPGDVEGGMPALDEPALAAALAALAPAHREVLLLRYRDDLGYAEIALVVGCSIGTVRSRLHNAKLRLHDVVRQHGLA